MGGLHGGGGGAPRVGRVRLISPRLGSRFVDMLVGHDCAALPRADGIFHTGRPDPPEAHSHWHARVSFDPASFAPPRLPIAGHRPAISNQDRRVRPRACSESVNTAEVTVTGRLGLVGLYTTVPRTETRLCQRLASRRPNRPVTATPLDIRLPV